MKKLIMRLNPCQLRQYFLEGMWTHVIISVVCRNVSYIALYNPLSGGYDDVIIPHRLGNDNFND
jgi:hypothetical protein